MYNSKTKISICLVIIFFLITLFTQFSYAQLDMPKANMNVDNALSYDLLEKIAWIKAQQMWGQVALGKPIPCCDDNGDIVVYMFPFHIGSTKFPEYYEIMKNIKEGRVEYKKLTKRLQEIKNNNQNYCQPDSKNNLPQRNESNFNLNISVTGPPELLTAEKLISMSDELYSARTKAKYKKYGINEYGTIYVSARSDRFPNPLRSHYLCPYYSMGDLALQKAQEVLGTTNVKLEHYYFLGLGRGQYFEFVSETKKILIEAYLLDVKSPEIILDRKGKKIEPIPEIMSEIDGKWEQIISDASLAEHTVDYPDLVPDVDWCRGCSPTAASMAIGYWDNYVNTLTYGGYGRLIDYWRELRKYSDNTGPLINVPNIVEELRIAMNTNVGGVTNLGNVSSAIEAVCNTINGYNFDSDQHRNESDWNWSVITNEIDNNRPFVWSVGFTDAVGHSLCAWGYMDDKHVITYSTWGLGRDEWYYNQYANGGVDIDWTYVHTVEPGGSQYPHTMVIGVPDGGETLDINDDYQISWHQWGTLIHDVDLWYSTNAGESWILIDSYVPSTEYWNTYSWTVPFNPTSRGRVRITAWDASSNYISGDGSFENFTITDTTPPSAPGTPADGGVWTSSTEVTFTWTSAIDNGTGVVDYHLQIGTSPGLSNIFNGWIGNTTTYTKDNCTHCQTLYARVCAKNGIGLIGPWSGSSDGIGIDHTPPTAPGTPADGGQWTNSTEVTFTWTPAEEDKSGITGYYLQIGTAPGASDLFNGWIGNVTTYTKDNCTHCQTIYARVCAKNGAETIGPWSGNSDGIGIDHTPPSIPGTPTDAGEYTISQNVTFSWTPSTDDKSGIIDYHLQVGTTQCGNELYDDWIGNVLKYTVTGSAGQTLYAKVRAKNGATTIGDWSECSNGITILPVDIAFSFNLASSMGDDITEMKLAANNIINHLIALNSDANYGVFSFVDYTMSYTCCEYSGQYGDEVSGDYPWNIEQQLTSDITAVEDAIDILGIYNGEDPPQDYSRALLECLFLDWRADSRKYLIMIGDTPAHDCDFFSQPYGTDPGEDAQIGTCDDLDYEKVVDWVDKAGITVITIDNGSGTGPTLDLVGDTWKNFEYMASETGGEHFMKSNWHDIPQAIEDISALGPKFVTEYPWIAEAEEMINLVPMYGSDCENGWRLTHEDQPIYNSVVFLTDAYYHFTVTAKAEIAGGAAPWLKIQIGDQFEGTCEINSTEWEDYSFITSLSAGFHCLSLTYLNDLWVKNVEDRNLLLDKVTIDYYELETLPTISYTFEAEKMKLIHSNIDGNYVKFYSEWSYITQDMFFEKQELKFKIYAKADKAEDGWPAMDFFLGDEQINEEPILVNTASDKYYEFHVTTIDPGEYRVKIRYHRDSYEWGRNLYIDKLVIESNGGFLKPVNEPLPDEKPAVVIPEAYALDQNYPNPFNPDTYINYQLPEETYVVIKIYNMLGKEINTLVNEHKSAGYYTAHWNGKDYNGNQVVSGVYLYQIKAGSYVCIKKMALLK